jgi:hypothetical protein
VNTVKESENPLGSLVGQELSGVVFVRDYIQLQFDDRGLTAVTLPTVVSKGGTYLSGMPGYRDSLCERIGHIVVDARMREDEGIELKFDDESVIAISLKREDYIGPEAAIFHDGSHPAWVW